jgi:hypothetical protein
VIVMRVAALLAVLLLCLTELPGLAAEGTWNLVSNPGFERGTSGWDAAWEKPGARVVEDPQGAHSGSRYLELKAENGNLSVDSDPSYVTWDFDRQQRHVVSAYVSKLDLKRGDFGLRFYCYDAEGKYLAMHGARSFGPGSSVDGWQEIRAEIGPGTRFEFPPAVDHVVVRFSFWSKEGDCQGSCRVDDVCFGPVNDAGVQKVRTLRRTAKGAVGLWCDRVPAAGGASDPRSLASRLEQAGFGVNLLDTREVTERSVLNAENIDLLVLPYGGHYPADTRALRGYLRKGGRLITLGGPCFTEPLYPSPDGWADSAKAAGASPKAIVELTKATVAGLADQAKKGPDPAEVSLGQDADGRPAVRVVVPELRGYRYLNLSGKGTDDHTILHFRARGDEQTKYLCLELTESDGSRWKAIVDLTPGWKTYELSTGQFVAYASKDRGGRNDYPHTDRIASVRFGFPANLVGKGHRTFELAEVQWRSSGLPAELNAGQMRLVPSESVLLRTFGAELKMRPRPFEVTTFFGSEAFSDVAGLRAAPGQTVFGPELTLGGQASGQTATILTDNLLLLERTDRRHRRMTPTEKLAYAVPLLLLPDGRPAASLFYHLSGDCAGGVWACFGVASRDLFPAADRAWGEAFVRLVEQMISGATLVGIRPQFDVEGGQVRMRVFVQVANHGNTARPWELHAQVADSAASKPRLEKTTAVQIEAGQTKELLAIEARADAFDWKKFRVDCRLLAAGREQSSIRTSVDVRDTLLNICDRLVETQRKRGDGKFSGIGYIDNRGARGLLAAYDLTGRKDYLEAALAWGRAQIAEQREDGGYLMGYGYYPEGNECYVADGGEIACAIGRLTSYTSKEDKERFFQSLKAYMGFRESFRCESGGIGVGWCKTDYGARPLKRLDKITKIYAPEQNIYTIGCTLAAATMYAQLTGRPADNDAAVRDAGWLMPRCQKTTTGAFVESIVWAHKYLRSPTIQQETAAFLREKLLPAVVGNEHPWWADGGGRSAQALDGLAYYHECIDKDPQVLATLINATCQICSPESLTGIPRLLTHGDLTHNQWHFVNFTAVSLPDLLQAEIVRKAF